MTIFVTDNGITMRRKREIVEAVAVKDAEILDLDSFP